MTLTDPERTYLDGQRLGRLATVAANGTVHNNPVGFRYNPDLGTIDIGGLHLGDSAKFRNVAATGQVSFVVDDLASTEPWRPRQLEIRGRAEALTGQQPWRPGMSPELIRIWPRLVFGFGVDPQYSGFSRRVVEAHATSD
jgi:pyridoxamine 5'-phosphate oxidase family protein